MDSVDGMAVPTEEQMHHYSVTEASRESSLRYKETESKESVTFTLDEEPPRNDVVIVHEATSDCHNVKDVAVIIEGVVNDVDNDVVNGREPAGPMINHANDVTGVVNSLSASSLASSSSSSDSSSSQSKTVINDVSEKESSLPLCVVDQVSVSSDKSKNVIQTQINRLILLPDFEH